MLLTPTTSKTMLRFPGVKATSKREAEKLLLAMHGFNEVDVRIRSAQTSGDSASSAVEIKDAAESFIVAIEQGVLVFGRSDRNKFCGVRRRQRGRAWSARGRCGGVVIRIDVFAAAAERGCWEASDSSSSGNYGRYTARLAGLEGTGRMCRICRRWLAQKSDSDPAL